jgi:hypothetical protein
MMNEGSAQPSGLIYHPPPATHITKFNHVSNEISVNHPPLLAQNRTEQNKHSQPQPPQSFGIPTPSSPRLIAFTLHSLTVQRNATQPNQAHVHSLNLA